MRGAVIRRKSKDGTRTSYGIKFRLADGSQKWGGTFKTKKDAERALSRAIADVHGGTYRELQEATFAEFAAKWLAYQKPRLKPSTYDGYVRYFERHWLPAFGPVGLTRLTTGAIQEVVARLQGDRLAGKSINNFLVPLKKMLGDAVKWGYLAINPATGIERARVERREMQALTPEQVRRLLAAARPDDWLFYATAVLTGLRRGELLGLQWRDVDFEAKQLRVARSVWRGQVISPKSERSLRRVDLAPVLAEALAGARPLGRAEDTGTSLIFPGTNGRPIEPDNFVKRRFLPTLERAELPRIRFHDLRHTYASLLIAAGEHPKYLQTQLGHSSITTTLDRYGHLLPGAYAHGGERLERTVLGGHQLPRPRS